MLSSRNNLSANRKTPTLSNNDHPPPLTLYALYLFLSLYGFIRMWSYDFGFISFALRGAPKSLSEDEGAETVCRSGGFPLRVVLISQQSVDGSDD